MNVIAYRFRLRPNKEQSAKLIKFAGQSRFVYNELLARTINSYKNGEKKLISSSNFCLEITKIKKDFPWLKESYLHCLQESGRNLADSYKMWFKWLKSKKGKRFGPPRFKSKKAQKTIIYKSGIKCQENMVRLPKVGWTVFKKSREIIGKIKRATVSLSATNKWTISIICERSFAKLPTTRKVVGIDFGLEYFVTTSEGEKINNPRWLAEMLGNFFCKLFFVSLAFPCFMCNNIV